MATNPRKEESGCSLVVTLTIGTTAQPGPTSLLVLDSDKKWMGRITFTVVDGVPGPIPPGLNPEVDTFWGVLPLKIVNDNFGRWVSKKYYAVQVVLGNNSGFDLQLASLGFLLRDANGKLPDAPLDDRDQNQFLRLPTDDYHVVRSTIEKQQIAGPRAYVLNSAQAAGLIGTGLSPFFHNVGHEANYTSALNLVNGPLNRAISLVWPDMTVPQLAKLDNLSMHDTTIISNNTQIRTIVYVSRESIKSRIMAVTANKDGRGCPRDGSAADKNCYWNPEDPEAVKYWLGNLIIVGNQIAYRQRIRITTAPNGTQVSELSMTPSTFTKAELQAGVAVTLHGDLVGSMTSPLELTNGVLRLTLGDTASDGKSRPGTLTLPADKTITEGQQTIGIPYNGRTANVAIQVAHLCGPAAATTLSLDDLKKGAKVSLIGTGCTASQMPPVGLPVTVNGVTFSSGGACGAEVGCVAAGLSDAKATSAALDTAKDRVEIKLSDGHVARLTNVKVE